MSEIDLKRAAADRKNRVNYDRGQEALKTLGVFSARDVGDDPEPFLELLVDYLVDVLHGADRMLDVKINLRPLAESAHALYELERNEAQPQPGEGPESR